MECVSKKQKPEIDERYNLVLPYPSDKSKQTPAQRWFIKNQNSSDELFFFIVGPWHVSGKAYVLCDDNRLHIQHHAELRFGKHGCMESFTKVCLFANFEKHEFENIQWNATSQTIYGTAGTSAVLFQVHPFQLDSLKRLQEIVGKCDSDTFIGYHTLFVCDKLNEEFK